MDDDMALAELSGIEREARQRLISLIKAELPVQKDVVFAKTLQLAAACGLDRQALADRLGIMQFAVDSWIGGYVPHPAVRKSIVKTLRSVLEDAFYEGRVPGKIPKRYTTIITGRYRAPGANAEVVELAAHH